MNMNDNKLISIVVPVYNVESYISRCINSILRQTYRNIEVVLVDDGSTDSSGDICDSYALLDSRITVIHKLNGGLSDARNTGVRQCKGELVSLIDSDDVISSDFIELLYRAYIETGSDLICCELVCFYDEDEYKLQSYWDRLSRKKVSYKKYESHEIIEKSFYQHISITGAPQKLYKRTLFDDIKFPAGRYFEDLATTYLFFEKANSVVVIDKKLYAYRMRKDSIMNRSFNRRKLDCIWVSDKLVKHFEGKKVEGIFCAAFRVNRLVYDQIPKNYGEEKKAVWNEIKKYRYAVATDKNAQKYERLIALLSYSGMHLLDFWLALFRLFRKYKYKNSL